MSNTVHYATVPDHMSTVICEIQENLHPLKICTSAEMTILSLK